MIVHEEVKSGREVFKGGARHVWGNQNSCEVCGRTDR